MTALDEIPFIASADVYKGGVHAATLSRSEGGTVFAYLDGYVGPPVATTLPLGDQRVNVGGAIPTFFAGLLPEGRRLRPSEIGRAHV